MIFGWWKRRRRGKILAAGWPEGWDAVLERVPHIQGLSAEPMARLRNMVQIFVAEKTWEGCRGLKLTDEIRVSIAAQACLLAVGLNDYIFDNVSTILVYPDAFRAPRQQGLGVGNAIIEGDTDLLGEAQYRGPVILSWDEIEEDLAQPGCGRNLVMHEFAHQIDMCNGEADGVPELPRELRGRWQKVMAKEYQKLTRSFDRGRRTFLDSYGATDPAEFFAVVTEYFFDVPTELYERHPALYEVFREYYRVDPREWKS